MKIQNALSVILLCLGLSACEPQFVRYPTDPHFNIDWHHHSKTHLLNAMRCAEIYVVQVGDQVRIIIPSDRLFYFDTAKLIPNYEPALLDVATFIRHYGPVNYIEVDAYTDNVREFCANKLLSTQQAKAVAGFLWASGISITTLRPIGFGPCCTVANNYTSRGSFYNRRVEIKFVAPTCAPHH
jgi:outer membrane protein OmpA-like peptidoglycan-associated protein